MAPLLEHGQILLLYGSTRRDHAAIMSRQDKIDGHEGLTMLQGIANQNQGRKRRDLVFD